MPPFEDFRATEIPHDLLEIGNLLEGESFVFVGRGKVGCDALDDQGVEFFDFREIGGEVLWEETAAPHSGVDGEVDAQADAPAFGDIVKGFGFGEGGNAGCDGPCDDFLTLLLPCGTKQVDGSLDTGVADPAGLTDVGDTQEGDVRGFENA